MEVPEIVLGKMKIEACNHLIRTGIELIFNVVTIRTGIDSIFNVVTNFQIHQIV